MISVLIFTESRFPVDRKRTKEFVETYLSSKVSGNCEVSISIVGDRKMKLLNTKYRGLAHTTDVLSFPVEDTQDSSKKDLLSGFSPDKSSPDKILRLGDVVVSYPQAVMEASEANKMVYEQIEFLLAHGLNHLMGIHHD